MALLVAGGLGAACDASSGGYAGVGAGGINANAGGAITGATSNALVYTVNAGGVNDGVYVRWFAD